MGFTTKRAGQPADHVFEDAVRADPRLNITARAVWLMVSLAHEHGYSSKSPLNMAADLTATVAAVRKARQKAVRLGLFAPIVRWRYHRILLPGEDADAFRRRAQADHRLDLATRAAWLLADITRAKGHATLSLELIGVALDTSVPEGCRAIRRVLELDHFTVIKGGGGWRNWNRYVRAGDIRSPQQLPEIDDEEDENFDPLAYIRQHEEERQRRIAAADARRQRGRR